MNKKYLGVLCIAFIGGLIGGILANKVPFLGEAFATSEKIIEANGFVLVDNRTGKMVSSWGLGDAKNSSQLIFLGIGAGKQEAMLSINMIPISKKDKGKNATISGNWGPSIQLMKNKHEFAGIGFPKEEPSLMLHGRSNKNIITDNRLTLYDRNRVERLSLEITNDESKGGIPCLYLWDQAGKNKGMLGIYESEGRLHLRDKKGKLKKN